MKEKKKRTGQFNRAMVLVFTAMLLLQAVPLQYKLSMTANASEAVNVSEASNALEVSNASEAANTSETSNASETADASETAVISETAKASEASNALETTDASEASNASEPAADTEKKTQEKPESSTAESSTAETGTAETGSKKAVKEEKTDTLPPQVSLVSNTGGEDRDGLLHVNDAMEFVLAVEDPDPSQEDQLQAQVFVRQEGAGDGERKLLMPRGDYSGQMAFRGEDMENAGLALEDGRKYVIEALVWDAAENEGRGSVTFAYDRQVTGAVAIEKGAGVREYRPEGKEIVYYNSAVKVR